MRFLYALGQHGAFVSIQGMIREGERLFAFHDDLYVVTVPNSFGAMFAVVQKYMRRAANIRVHLGRAPVWRVFDLPTAEQGIKVLGTSLGHEDFVAAHLRNVLESHRTLLERYRWCRTSFCFLKRRSPCELSVAGRST